MRRTLKALIGAFAILAMAGMPGYAAEEKKEEKKNDSALVKNDYKGGFKFGSADGKFSMRLFSAIQFRYTYLAYDDAVQGNQTDYSNFFIRRARLWWDGHAYSPNFTYYFHLQIEPSSSVNLHDAWIEYKFNDNFILGLGRNKIPYGLEFLNSGFGLNFIDRSIMYGETDIQSGNGLSKWPGSNATLGLNTLDANTGFPTGGMSLFRSQGVSLRGGNLAKDSFAWEYQVGVWQGRTTTGGSNPDDNHLFAARFGFYPNGWINWLFAGDGEDTQAFKWGVLFSAYNDSNSRTKNAAGTTVPLWESDDSGFNVAVETRYRGFSADFEWSKETYELDPSVLSQPENEAERSGWRAAFGYFFVPKKFEVVARYAELTRLEDPTSALAADFGLKTPKVWNPATETYASVLEDKLTEFTIGANWYLNSWHQHKFFIDYSQLGRSFLPTTEGGFAPGDQKDNRFRAMLQFKF